MSLFWDYYWLTLNNLAPYAKIFIAKFEHVFVSWNFLSREKSVTGVWERIIYRVVGLAPRFLSDKIRVRFTQGCVCFIPFQRVKQTHGIFHLLLNRQDVILLCLCVQVDSKVLLFQKKFFLQRITVYPIIKSFLNLRMLYPMWLYKLILHSYWTPQFQNFATPPTWLPSHSITQRYCYPCITFSLHNFKLLPIC